MRRMVTTTDRHPLWFLAGVFLTCMCGLMLQIIETRVLSVLANYNLAFVAISVAMLGLTAGALATGALMGFLSRYFLRPP